MLIVRITISAALYLGIRLALQSYFPPDTDSRLAYGFICQPIGASAWAIHWRPAVGFRSNCLIRPKADCPDLRTNR